MFFRKPGKRAAIVFHTTIKIDINEASETGSARFGKASRVE